MPIGKGKYRIVTTPSGKRVRLHFRPDGEVDEAQSLVSGETHTPAEFAADRKRRRRPSKER